jgi:hypothetical protein
MNGNFQNSKTMYFESYAGKLLQTRTIVALSKGSCRLPHMRFLYGFYALFPLNMLLLVYRMISKKHLDN